MPETIEFTIDGKKVSGAPGATVLQVAREYNIRIPALCVNDSVMDYGACRVCMVEATSRGRKRLVTACMFPISAGLEVRTQTEHVMKIRRGVLELMLARTPRAEAVQRLAAEYGVAKPNPRFIQDPENKCILCGLCIRACAEVVGVSAIHFSGRGVTRKVCTPYDEGSNACIGCGTCAFVCPTDVIPFEEKGGVRKIWHREFALRRCQKCGCVYMPEAQIEHIKKNLGIPDEFFNNCPDCR